MEKLKLSPRLAAIAAFVQRGDCLVDVGCDHGYLPVWLLENGVIDAAVAADINEKPLKKAADCAAAHGLSDRMLCVLTDGLAGIDLSNINAVSIAGMGGETIVHILENAPEIKSKPIKLLLQPMSKTEMMLEWLYKEGFYVENERLVEDSDKLYRVFLVLRGERQIPPPARLLAGETLFLQRDPLLEQYLAQQCGKLRRACEGMKSSADPEILKKAAEHQAILQQLEAWKEEYCIDNGSRCV